VAVLYYANDMEPDDAYDAAEQKETKAEVILIWFPMTIIKNGTLDL
jgi:hypothetical protein